MMRRLTVSIALVAAGFLGGLVVTGWVRAAETFRAPEVSSATTAAPQAAAPRPAAATQPTSPLAMAGGVPDFTRVAALGIKGVANISSLQVRQVNSPFASDPFFRYFFGDDDA